MKGEGTERVDINGSVLPLGSAGVANGFLRLVCISGATHVEHPEGVGCTMRLCLSAKESCLEVGLPDVRVSTLVVVLEFVFP